jgi:hypothetical protein
MNFPVAGRGRPRTRHVPDQGAVAAETIMADLSGRSVTWRRGTKGRRRARFCALRVRMADDLTQRVGAIGNQHRPGDEVAGAARSAAQASAKRFLSLAGARQRIKDWRCRFNENRLHTALGGLKPRSVANQAARELAWTVDHKPGQRRPARMPYPRAYLLTGGGSATLMGLPVL